MSGAGENTINVTAIVDASPEKVWQLWTIPFHVLHWNHASDDWLTTYAENDLRRGSTFLYRMEARNGSEGFDFTGKYDIIVPLKKIEYTLTDGRRVLIEFEKRGKKTLISENFEPEDFNPPELQKAGWQAILNNFKRFAEKAERPEALHFEIIIRDTPENVLRTMLADETYRAWTSLFNPYSYYKGSWEKRSKMLFIGCDSDGNTGGMVSRVRDNIPGKFISIEHIGILKGDEEITAGPEADAWKGSLENYSFTASGHNTILSVDVDSNEEFISYFSETWPKALEKLRYLCEQ